MKTLKKFVAITAAVLMLCSVLPMGVVAADNVADFNTVTKTNTSYGTATTTNGWKAENSAVLAGAASGNNNPNFTFIDTNTATRAFCMNGKTSAVGKITSPTLTGGISKLTLNYGLPFGDTKISFTITINATNGSTASKTVNPSSVVKQTKYDLDWTLDTPITGDFTIVIKNNCPSNKNSNTDRTAVWNVAWESADSTGGEEPPVSCEHESVSHTAAVEATCVDAGNIEYWYCEDCETYFADEECTEEITESELEIAATGEHNYVDGVCTVCKGEEPQGFELVTSVDQLKVGAQIIIVAADYNKAMGAQDNTNYRTPIDITKNDDIVAPVDGVVVFTLEAGTVDGTYAFKDDTGYLSAPGDGNNLRTAITLSASSSWAITITDGAAEVIAQIDADQKYLQYNSGSPRFSCYKNTQQDVSIYILPTGGGDEPECEHEYDNEFDIRCNVCGAVRAVVDPDVQRIDISYVGASVMEKTDDSTSGLAMSFSVEAKGIAYQDGSTVVADFTNAKITINDKEYDLESVGVIAGNTYTKIQINGERMYRLDEDGTAYFAYRITNIPADHFDTEITMTPYYIVKDGDETITFYGEAVVGSYNEIAG